MPPLFSSTQPSLRARVLPRFPARVVAGSGIAIVKSGLTYTFSADIGSIPITSMAPIGADRLIGRDTGGDGPPEELTVGGGLQFTGAGGLQLANNQRIRALSTVLFNNGAVLTTGVKADILVPFSCTIVQATLLADQSGSIVVDIWKDTYANYPPTVADTITAGTPPTISGATKSQNSTLSGWITAITAGDTLRFNINSIATLTRVTVYLDVVTV